MKTQTKEPQTVENGKVSKKILLVDDHEASQLLVMAYLKNSFCSVDIAKNGQQGVEKFESKDYDLVLMDMQMPVMNGFEATRRMRDIEVSRAKKPVAIIALTAHSRQQDQENTMKAGCTAHLTKPIGKNQLLNAIMQTIPDAEENDLGNQATL